MKTEDIIFHTLNFITGSFVLACGLITLFDSSNFEGFVLGAFFTFFGILIILFEIIVPEIIGKEIHFYFNFLGRGLFYLFLGCLLFDGDTDDTLFVIGSIVCVATAIFYIVIWLVIYFGGKNIEFPKPLRSTEPSSNASEEKEVDNAVASIILHVFNLLVGACVLGIGIWSLFNTSGFRSFAISCFFIIFGITMILLEFLIPAILFKEINFYFHFLGRSLWCLFLSCLIGGWDEDKDFQTFTAIILLTSFIIYFIFWILRKFNVYQCGLPYPWCSGGSKDYQRL